MRLSYSHVLREYAVLADGHRGIVVGPRGDYAWMCFPHWDGEGIFSSLLGGEGTYVVAPEGVDFTWGGSYEPGTLVWRSRWVTTDGIVECREALAYPGEPGRAVLLRRVECHSGQVRVRVELEPAAGFGAHGVEDLHRRRGVWTGRTGPVELRWSGAQEARVRQGALHLHLDLRAGDSRDLVLELCEGTPPEQVPNAELLWQATASSWSDDVPRFDDSIAPRDARHAYAVLRGLTVPGGGMVAAVTTSLPERADAGENYDYRFAWIRDQSLAGQAVAAAGHHGVLDDAVAFVSARLLADGPRLAPAYTVRGEEVPRQRTLDLPGYPGADARVGNWVRRQFQLDAFGEALLLLAAAADADRLDLDQWRAVETGVEAIEQRWRDEGAGMWETRTASWTHSRLICAAGVRAVARHAPREQASSWSALADGIVAHTSRSHLHPDGHWQRSTSDPRVDASLLQAGIRGALPADDPRTVATLERVLADLGQDFYVYRFRHDERPLHAAEGAFLLSGFDMALALHQQGREAEALRWFERNRSACGPAGIFTEEFDVVQRQLRGNLPQAFVHALMLEAAIRLAAPQRRP